MQFSHRVLTQGGKESLLVVSQFISRKKRSGSEIRSQLSFRFESESQIRIRYPNLGFESGRPTSDNFRN